MAISYFAGYELISSSSLFDADFYRRGNPDVAQARYDPVAHYLEVGAKLGLDPHPDFDTAYYLRQCLAVREAPDNPLIHYLQVGEKLGLATRPSDQPQATTPELDVIRLDTLTVERRPEGALALGAAGWLAMSEPVESLAVEVDGVLLGYANHGLDRPDVSAMFPAWPDADSCGFRFAAEWFPERLHEGMELVLSARLTSDRVEIGRFPIVVPEAGPTPDDGTAAFGGPPVRIQVDQAVIDGQGVITIDGWAVAMAPILSLDVWLDGERLGAAERGVRREDVAEAWPTYLDPMHGGFRFVTDGRALGEGRRDFSIHCQIQGGVTRVIELPLVLPPAAVIQARSDSGEARLHCDEVRLTTDGALEVTGWAVCPTGVTAVLLFLDGQEIGEARIGLERPDVGNAFPTMRGSRNAGFTYSARPAPEGVSGEHVLAIRVRSSEGTVGRMRLPIAAIPVEALAVSQPGQSERGITLYIDEPAMINGVASAPVRNTLSIAGWAVAADGIEGISIAFDGKHAVSAFHGLKRDDVAGLFPDQPGALRSGFAALLPNRALPKGDHVVSVIARDKTGGETSVDFTITVEEVEDEEAGPWSLRRRMPQSEIDLNRRILAAESWRAGFRLLLRAGSSDEEIAAARLTLRSLADQAFENWSVVIAPLDANTDFRRLKRQLLRGFDDISAKVGWTRPGDHGRSIDRVLRGRAAPGDSSVLGVLTGGDELGVDALLAFASWMARRPDDDLVYADERRVNLGTGKLDAFFKPDWSPDLALAVNYVGRPWLARTEVWAGGGVTLGELMALGEYDLLLRCVEQARSIGHVASVLCERATDQIEDPALGRAALERTLARRGIGGQVLDGRAPGLFEIERRHAVESLVSIVIPTCAAKGYIKTCIETLRARTSYRNFEIVCIENIAAKDIEWRVWLKANADRVVTTEEPFNWSRYNNIAAAESRGEYIVFLNDDIEIVSPNWLNVLLSHAARPEVGVVGPLLLYPDRSIQHAGMFLANMGTARHAFRFAAEDEPGYFGLTLSERNVSCVTGACLMVRREVYDRLGGFDETHTVINNDLDFCLRVREQGLLIVFTPRTKLIHYELASRIEMSDDYDTTAFDDRWGETFLRGDPYFNRNLSRDEDHYGPEREPLRVVFPSHPLIARDKVRRILLVKVDHIGDCVTALPAIRRIRELFPKARLCMMCAPSTQSIFSLVEGIDEIIPYQFFYPRSADGEVEQTKEATARLQARLAPYRFDLAIDLRKTTDTRHLLQFTGARYLAGYSRDGVFPWLDITIEWEGDSRLRNKHSHVSDDYLRLAEAVGLAVAENAPLITAPPGGSPLPADLAERLHARRVVVVHPATGAPTKEWPLPYYAQLINLLVGEFDVNIAIIGAPGEQAIADTILETVRRQDRVTSLIGVLSLANLAAFLPSCALFVGNDSGPGHMAAALGVPTVSVHAGIIASEEWGPTGPLAVAVRKSTFCSPCYIPKPEDCHRRLACLTRMTAGEVLEVCRGMLPPEPPGQARGAGVHPAKP